MDKVLEGIDEAQKKLFEEQCILVDHEDHVIGHASKLDCHSCYGVPTSSIPLHRAFSVLLFNSKNEMLLQRRSIHKATFPLYWSNTCCSHPLYLPAHMDESKPFEGVKVAAIARLQLELGIPAGALSPDMFTVTKRFLYRGRSSECFGEHEVDNVLCIRVDLPEIPFNPNEVDSVRYVTQSGLQEFIHDENNLCSPWFLFLCRSSIKSYFEEPWKTTDGSIEILDDEL